MKQNEDIVEEFLRKKKHRDEKGLLSRKRAYYNRAKRGDWRWYVWEYEDEYRQKYKERIGENKMEWKFRLQLTRDYQVADVELSGITDADFENAKELVWAEAKEALSRLPKKIDAEIQPKKTYEKKQNSDYSRPATQYNPNGGKITTRFAKGKQVGLLQQGIDKGIFTLEEVNNIDSWDTTQEYIQAVFRSGKR